MEQFDVVVQNKVGLHARPASLFVKEANKQKCSVKVLKDGKEYNAKSIMSILSMGAHKGTQLSIITDGEGEKEVMQAIKKLFDSNFGED